MNTNKKNTPFDCKLVPLALMRARACNHRFRLQILEELMNADSLFADELAEALELDPTYVLDHLHFLEETGLISSELTSQGLLFYANAPMVHRTREALSAFAMQS